MFHQVQAALPERRAVDRSVMCGLSCFTRCKLFYQKDGQWADRGVGNLHIKPVDDGRSQLIIRADTNLGKPTEKKATGIGKCSLGSGRCSLVLRKRALGLGKCSLRLGKGAPALGGTGIFSGIGEKGTGVGEIFAGTVKWGTALGNVHWDWQDFLGH